MMRLMFSLKNLLPKQSIIAHQLIVYVAWIELHHGWHMAGDKRWINMFIEREGLQDVHHADGMMVDRFLKHVSDEFPSDWAVKHARIAVSRFIRFYKARGKSFTESPRYVPTGIGSDLSTEMA